MSNVQEYHSLPSDTMSGKMFGFFGKSFFFLGVLDIHLSVNIVHGKYHPSQTQCAHPSCVIQIKSSNVRVRGSGQEGVGRRLAPGQFSPDATGVSVWCWCW